MNTDSAREDLAYLRSLVQGGGEDRWQVGEGYLAAGLCYGGQVLAYVVQDVLGLPPRNGPTDLLLGAGPTVLFIAILIWMIRRNRTPRSGSVAQRAVGAVFASVGLANLVLVAIIGSVSAREHSQLIFFIYPCVVFVLQGMAWLVMGLVRRRGTAALMALGWFAVAGLMAAVIEDTTQYMGALALGLIGLMAIPGAVMMLRARRPA
jgi:hypothetical protein